MAMRIANVLLCNAMILRAMEDKGLSGCLAFLLIRMEPINTYGSVEESLSPEPDYILQP